MIQLPDLKDLFPVVGLALVAALCVVALIVHGLLRSRVAMWIAVVIGVVVAGPALAGALTNIVWALVPLGVVVIIGGLAGLWLIGRNPDLLEMVRDVVPRKSYTYSTPPEPLALPDPNQASAVVVNQPHSAAAPQRTRTIVVNGDTDRWGF